MSTFDRLADLPLQIDGYELEAREQNVSSGFLRRSTTFLLRGGGHEGVGEDVTYDAEDQEALQRAGADAAARRARWTLGSFCDHLEALDLWPEPPRARRLARLPRLGLRVRRARPRAAPGRHVAARAPRAASRGR